MDCRLIQSIRLDPDNRAEQEMLNFLKYLPPGYTVYCELQLSHTYEARVMRMQEKKPDFVVLAPDVGLFIIEVKDWNLHTTRYTWLDQETVLRNDTEQIRNPLAQAKEYQWAFVEMIKKELPQAASDLFVTAVVAFPRLTRTEFLNALGDPQALGNQQSSFLLDMEQTIFKDDLTKHRIAPEVLLQSHVTQVSSKRTGRPYSPASGKSVAQVGEYLLPSSFRIGDYEKRRANRERIQMITEEQQQWIFDTTLQQEYLLDVPGSGKTNALISKAIHLVDEAGRRRPPRILLTTYSKMLEANIAQIFQDKIAGSLQQRRYEEAITILSVPSLLEAMIATAYGVEEEDFRREHADKSEGEYEALLLELAEVIVDSSDDRFKQFDCVFVDEYQDFDTRMLGLVLGFGGKGCRHFFVGDLGQKIYDRYPHLKRLIAPPARLELRRSHKMFRTPRYIAELATRFLLEDQRIRHQLKEEKYDENFVFPNQLDYGAVLDHAAAPVAALAERAADLLINQYTTDDLLVVASPAKLVAVQQALAAHGIACTINDTSRTVPEGKVRVVDFMHVKGLEKLVVLVTGIEDLPDRNSGKIFDDVEARMKQERFSRRKIYVSLTRSIEQLFVFYCDPNNRFIDELCAINNKIVRRRQGGR